MSFVLTDRQQEAYAMLCGPHMHCMLFGGARSGKTWLLCRTIAVRAIKEPKSRHLIARFRFNHVKASIWHDTFPKMMGMCFPQIVPRLKLDKTDWRIILPNKSEIWFGGLDDKERTEKILGQEYASIYLNECSQIGHSSWETVKTRLAQKTGLKLKFYYDENPPLATHWTHKLFIEKRRPEPPYASLPDPEEYCAMQINPAHNAENLDPKFLQNLQTLSARAKLRYWDGQFGSANENSLWTYETIEKHRRTTNIPDMLRVVIGVDPSGTSGEDDERSDHVGIVAVGIGTDGDAYVLEDATVKAGPDVWGRHAVELYARHQADCLVAESNFGGAMVAHVIRSASSAQHIPVNFREVVASRGKVVRAEPIAALYEQGKVHHAGTFPMLEDQLCSFTTSGYMGDRSPDRGDAMIWALSDLFMGLTRKAPRSAVSTEGASGYDPLQGF